VQDQKHFEQRISTVHGITIDWSDEYEKAKDSIRHNRELESNEIDDSNSSDSKHDIPRMSISDAISTCD
jgi:hypothetical protein